MKPQKNKKNKMTNKYQRKKEKLADNDFQLIVDIPLEERKQAASQPTYITHL